jgi:ATP-dependent exoDNAse (exonuclease V) beta subunit
VFDYKSNRIETEADMRATAEGYAFQMRLYARAAARLLNLDPARVATLLLFTRKGWILPG